MVAFARESRNVNISEIVQFVSRVVYRRKNCNFLLKLKKFQLLDVVVSFRALLFALCEQIC